MTSISNNDIARAIYLSSKDKSPSEMHQVHEKVINFLVRRRLISKSSSILLELKKIINSEHGIVPANVFSAHRLHEKKEKNLVHFLKKRYSAKEVALNPVLDKPLLGGMRVEVSDEVIDLTLKNKVEQLQKYLTRTV